MVPDSYNILHVALLKVSYDHFYLLSIYSSVWKFISSSAENLLSITAVSKEFSELPTFIRSALTAQLRVITNHRGVAGWEGQVEGGGREKGGSGAPGAAKMMWITIFTILRATV